MPHEDGSPTMPGNHNTTRVHPGIVTEYMLVGRKAKNLTKPNKNRNLLIDKWRYFGKTDAGLIDDTASEL